MNLSRNLDFELIFQFFVFHFVGDVSEYLSFMVKKLNSVCEWLDIQNQGFIVERFMQMLSTDISSTTRLVKVNKCIEICINETIYAKYQTNFWNLTDDGKSYSFNFNI